MEVAGKAQITEFFHVAFLDVLSGRLDPARYVLKGGANLRYFFESLRYSEDIDLDVNGVEPWGLEEKVDGVLDSGAMKVLLRAGWSGNRGLLKAQADHDDSALEGWDRGLGPL